MSVHFVLLRQRARRASTLETLTRMWIKNAEKTQDGQDRLRFLTELGLDAIATKRIAFVVDHNLLHHVHTLCIAISDERDAVAWRLEFGDEPIKSLLG